MSEKSEMFGVRVSAEKMALLKLHAGIAGKSVSAYVKALIDEDIESGDIIPASRETLEFQVLSINADIKELERELNFVKELLIKVAKAAVTTAIISESNTDNEIKQRARETAINFIDAHKREHGGE